MSGDEHAKRIEVLREELSRWVDRANNYREERDRLAERVRVLEETVRELALAAARAALEVKP